MKKTGSQIIIECLKKEGVDTSSIIGGAILPLFDEFINAPSSRYWFVTSRLLSTPQTDMQGLRGK
jgi:thiamine pyrophosphate-dependent acetolactate synthase large subunit-like protein